MSSATICAVSASIVSVILCIWPCFISRRMTSTARSDMRFASSWIVIVSGMMTSRMIFSLGSFEAMPFMRWTRRLNAATERVRSSSPVSTLVTVRRPRDFSVPAFARSGLAGAGAFTPGLRTPRFSSSSSRAGFGGTLPTCRCGRMFSSSSIGAAPEIEGRGPGGRVPAGAWPGRGAKPRRTVPCGRSPWGRGAPSERKPPSGRGPERKPPSGRGPERKPPSGRGAPSRGASDDGRRSPPPSAGRPKRGPSRRGGRVPKSRCGADDGRGP